MSQHTNTHRRILEILNDYLEFACDINESPVIKGVFLVFLPGKIFGSDYSFKKKKKKLNC